MDRKIKTKWLKALRSGKYKQTKNVLRKARGGFCCLGVLCDIVKPDGWYKDQDKVWGFQGSECTYDFPPTSILAETGLPTELGSDLAVMNDSGRSFKEIADYIEERV
jgi:hypothetical protein